jgi:hypothetical protein
MKTIIFLKNLTFIEICLNIILAIGFNISMLSGNTHTRNIIFIPIAVLHTSSMLLHWLGWKQLATTHKERIFFNLWVIGTFLIILTISLFSAELTLLMLYFLLYFSFAWFMFYCWILLKEYKFLKRKKELYDQRELIHF